MRDARGLVLEDIQIGGVVDGTPMTMVIDKPRTTPKGPTHVTAHVVLRGQESSIDAELGYTMMRAPWG